MNLTENDPKYDGAAPDSLEMYSVLIAEDDRGMADLLAITLRRAGHRVVGIAWDGKEAVRLALSKRPDLVIMDVHMPFLDGLQAAGEILSAGPVPIILSTGLVDLGTIQRAMDVHCLSYLVKPFSPAQLHVAIHLAVAQCRVVREADASDAQPSFAVREIPIPEQEAAGIHPCACG